MSKQLTINRLKRIQLEDIRERKAEIRNELSLQKDVIAYSAKKMFSPFTGNDTTGSNTKMVKKFNTGLAVIDGLLVGYKMIKGVKNLFRRR